MDHNISDKKPPTIRDYSSRLAAGGHLLGWQDHSDRHANWEEFFELPDPITYATSNGPTSIPADQGKSNISRNSADFLGQSDNPAGFVRPLYRFISRRLTSIEKSREDYRRVAGQFDLNTPPTGLTSQMSAYRNALSLQIERQATEAWRINQQMAEVLKVFYRETGQAVRDQPNLEQPTTVRSDRPLVFREIRHLFDVAIVGGETGESLTNYWIPEIITSNRFVTGQLKEATAGRLLSLARSREPILHVAEGLACTILPLETMLEHLISGRDFSEVDHARRNMPDPWLVARDFQRRAKYAVYKVDIVAMAMTETREYILAHNLQSLRRHVEAIKRIVSGKISVHPDPKTIRNWITTYGRQVFGEEEVVPRTL